MDQLLEQSVQELMQVRPYFIIIHSPFLFTVIVSPDRGHTVDFNIPDLLFEPGVSFTVTWSPELIIPFEDPTTYTVDIALYEYDVTSSIWKELEKLATDVPNSGKRTVTVTDNTVDIDVRQVAVQIAVSRAATSNIMVKRQTQFTALFRKIGIWSGVAYLAFSLYLRNQCIEWCESQPPSIGQEILDRLPPCPPTMQRAVEDSRFEEETLSSKIYFTIFDDQWRNFFHKGAASCFRQTTFTRYTMNTAM